MTRSIFDPTGPNTERSGGRFTGPDSDNRSHMPESAVDGVVEADVVDSADDIVDMEPAAKPQPDAAGDVDVSSP